MDAPAAFTVEELPIQIVGEFTVTVGLGVTVTTEVTVPVQPPAVPVIVYVVVVAGFAVTLTPVVALNPVPGLHV